MIQSIQYLIIIFYDLEFLVELAKAAVMQITGKRAKNIAKEVFKSTSNKEAA